MDPSEQGAPPQDNESTGGIFDPYLQAVPEDAREYVAGYLKDAEKNVNSRLSQAAETEKSFGPYKELGLDNYQPDQLQQLLQWYSQVSTSEDAFKEWIKDAAKEAGLTLAEAEQVAEQAEEEDLTREQVEQLASQRAQELVQPLEQRQAEWEEQRQIDTIESEAQSELSSLEAENKLKLSDEQKAMVIDLGLNHEGNDWIKHGFERFREITAEGQRTFVEQKISQPGTPVTSGGQEAFKPTTDWNVAQEQAKERLRQALTS